MVAALAGKLHGVKWFLERGATVTSVKSNGWNVLHFAAQGSDPDTIDLVLTHLPDIESKTANECCFKWQRSSGEKYNVLVWLVLYRKNCQCWRFLKMNTL